MIEIVEENTSKQLTLKFRDNGEDEGAAADSLHT